MPLNVLPIILGFVAGITVYIGAIALYVTRKSLSRTTIGFLEAIAGGILAYLALDVGGEASEYVENLAKPATTVQFLIAAGVTAIALLATFALLSYLETNAKKNNNLKSMGIYTSYIVAVALGVHNIGEGFAIAASLLSQALVSAVLLTIGFGIHNATEGFAVVGPIVGETKNQLKGISLLGLSMLAGLPTVLGAAVFYTGVNSELFLAVLNTIATASIVYAMLHVNLSALSKLGGVSSPLFWTALTVGVIIAFGTESILLFALP